MENPRTGKVLMLRDFVAAGRPRTLGQRDGKARSPRLRFGLTPMRRCDGKPPNWQGFDVARFRCRWPLEDSGAEGRQSSFTSLALRANSDEKMRWKTPELARF